MVISTIRYKAVRYLELMRIKVCLITVFAILIGALISGSFVLQIPYLYHLAAALIAGFVITGFGNTINDYFDYNIDSTSTDELVRERPLPSGTVGLREAVWLALLLAIIGAVLAYNVSTVFFYLGLINILISFIYARILKHIVLAKNISVAWLGASAFIGGSLIASPVIDLPIVVIASVAFLATISWEILKDMRDLKADVANKVRTVPYYLGEKRTKITVYALLAAAFVILFVAHNSFNIIYLVGVLPALAVVVYSTRLDIRGAYRMIRIGTWLVILGLLASALI